MSIIKRLYGRGAEARALRYSIGEGVAHRTLRDVFVGLEITVTVTGHVASAGVSKFGQDRFIPRGSWLETTNVISINEPNELRGNLQEFGAAVRTLESTSGKYGVRLRRERFNKRDAHAIAVDGYAGGNSWHIGYLSRDLAREIYSDLLNRGVPVEAALESVLDRDGRFGNVRIQLLAPPAYGVKDRRKR